MRQRATINFAQRGVYAVEMALLIPVLVLLLFGIIEVGMLFNSVSIIKAGAREGCRLAAIGATTSQIATQVQTVCAGLAGTAAVTCWYREDRGEWVELSDIAEGDEMVNSAPAGSLVKVVVTYRHTLLTNNLFPGLGDNGAIQLQASMIMRRE